MKMANWLNRFGQLRQPDRKQLSDPYYRFRSVAELQRAAAQGQRIDVNQATVDDWLRLPGLSIHQARSLVTLSQSGVPFHCLEDIAAALSLPPQRLQPLAPILQFCYYEPFAQPVNLNRATVEQLIQIPAIDCAFAERILVERQHGLYRDLSDFQQRLQLSHQEIARLMHFVCL